MAGSVLELTVPLDLKGLLRLGTCSWKYDSWRGLIYESGRPYQPADYLADYAKVLDSSASVAGKPNPHFLDNGLLRRFLDLLAPLGRKLGPIRFQFEYLNRQKMPSEGVLSDRILPRPRPPLVTREINHE
jgi:hypothetical protein